MKNVTTIFLACVFAAQLVLAGLMYYRSSASHAAVTESALVAQTDGVDSLVVAGDDGSVSLARVDGEWLLGKDQLPVDQNKVSTVLESLAAVKTGWPVAKKKNSHNQLEVAEDNHQLRVTLATGADVQADFYLGSSPGFRASHLRRADEDEVYSVKLNNYDIPTDEDGWLDQSLLRLESISAVTRGGETISLHDDSWAAAGEVDVDQNKAKALVNGLQTIWVIGLHDAAMPDEDIVELAVTGADADYQYAFHRAENTYLVARSDINRVFRIAKAGYENVISPEASSLYQQIATDPQGDDNNSGSNEPEDKAGISSTE